MYTELENNDVVTKQKLMADFKVVIADAEELLKATAQDASEKAVAARARIETHLSDAKAKLAALEEVVAQRAKQAADATDQYVRENPWKAVGVAAGVGVLLGMLIGRR
ncbi:MAG: DUF883 domain-containing protein [Sulfuricella sp.]|nr:DUF883 domain-containing protein [Sulfuricella sp.]